jgi:8-oxo-dGTP diphosphatase
MSLTVAPEVTGNPIPVAAAIFLRDDHVLLAQRPPGDPLEGLWELPGGTVKEDETPEACLQRELAEECGVAASVGHKYAASSYVHPHATVTLIAYLIDDWSGEIVAHEHSEIRWVNLREARRLPLAPADVPIITRLQHEYA